MYIVVNGDLYSYEKKKSTKRDIEFLIVLMNSREI